MDYKKINLNVKSEQQIISMMIISDEYLKNIIDILQFDLFKDKYNRIIAKWCGDYYKTYSCAPGDNIIDIFKNYVKEKDIDDTKKEIMFEFLNNLDFDNTNSNIKYLLDRGEKYFKKRKLELLKEDLNALIINNNILEAENLITDFKRYEKPKGAGVDILNDRDALYVALSEETEYLFRFPGQLGEFIGNFLRGDLIAVAAPSKRGKTFWLIDIAFKAILAKYNVLYVNLEMTENKMLQRIYQGFTGETLKAKVIEIPYYNEIGSILFKSEKKRGLTFGNANKKRIAIKKMIRDKSNFRMLTFPSESLTIQDLNNHIDNFEYYENFIPDVIIVDYADLMVAKNKEYRHALDFIWKSLRGMAQNRNMLIVTASQTNTGTYDQDIKEGHMAEDYRKITHTALTFGLNQKSNDKKKGAMYINKIVDRNNSFDIKDMIEVLYNYDISKVCLDSRIIQGD